MKVECFPNGVDFWLGASQMAAGGMDVVEENVLGRASTTCVVHGWG